MNPKKQWDFQRPKKRTRGLFFGGGLGSSPLPESAPAVDTPRAGSAPQQIIITTSHRCCARGQFATPCIGLLWTPCVGDTAHALKLDPTESNFRHLKHTARDPPYNSSFTIPSPRVVEVTLVRRKKTFHFSAFVAHQKKRKALFF